MAERVTQHEMTEPDPLGDGRKRAQQGPALEGVELGCHRRRHVVHEPQGIEAGVLGDEYAVADRRVVHTQLREEQTEPRRRESILSVRGHVRERTRGGRGRELP